VVSFVVGEPGGSDEVEIGPMGSKAHFDRVAGSLERAKKAGVRVCWLKRNHLQRLLLPVAVPLQPPTAPSAGPISAMERVKTSGTSPLLD